MNAQAKQVDPQDEAYAVPQIKKLLAHRRQAQDDLGRYEREETAAAQRFLSAEAQRMQNTDHDKIPVLRRAAKEAEDRLADAKEARRVADARLKAISSQIDAAVIAWKQAEKERVLEEWRAVNSGFDEQVVLLQRKRIEKANAAMNRLHELDSTFAHVLVYGNPNFYLTDDILKGKRLPSFEIEDNRATFKWLELPVAIKT